MKRQLYFLLLFDTFVIMCGGVMTPLWSDYLLHLGGDTRSSGIAVAIFFIAYGVCTQIAAVIINKLKHHRFFIIISNALVILGYVAFFFIQHTWQLYCVLAYLGIIGSFEIPAFAAIYNHYVPNKASDLAWGTYETIYAVAIGLAGLCGGFLHYYMGYDAVFIFLICLSALALLVSIIVLSLAFRNYKPLTS